MFNIIPTPENISGGERRVSLPALVSAPECFADAAATLCDFARRIHGVSIRAGQGGIELVCDTALPEEGYALTVTEGGATVRAADIRGAHNGAMTLIQLMESDGEALSLPDVSISDRPECSWRGVLLDLARNWHELGMILEYVDMCRFYKVKYLHLHFTDDQSYTLPSRAFPKLSIRIRLSIPSTRV